MDCKLFGEVQPRLPVEYLLLFFLLKKRHAVRNGVFWQLTRRSREMYCANAAKDRLLSSGATQNVHFLVSTSKPGSKVAKNMNRNEKRFRFFVRRACKTDAWFWYYTQKRNFRFFGELKKCFLLSNIQGA